MSQALAAEPETPRSAAPRVLVFSTNTISDPGIDLAGSTHMHYSPEVLVLSLPCTSGIRPAWILHALQQGFDGVFIASDGDECAYLPGLQRALLAHRRGRAGAADGARNRRTAAEAGRDLLGLRRPVHQARS